MIFTSERARQFQDVDIYGSFPGVFDEQLVQVVEWTHEMQVIGGLLLGEVLIVHVYVGFLDHLKGVYELRFG